MKTGPKGVKRGGDQHDILRWFLYSNKKGAVSFMEIAPFKSRNLVKTAVPALVRRGFLSQVGLDVSLTPAGVWAVLVHEFGTRSTLGQALLAMPRPGGSPATPGAGSRP